MAENNSFEQFVQEQARPAAGGFGEFLAQQAKAKTPAAPPPAAPPLPAGLESAPPAPDLATHVGNAQILAEDQPPPVLAKPPKPPKLGILTLNRVDRQGNRVPMEQTPGYQQAQKWVQSADPSQGPVGKDPLVEDAADYINEYAKSLSGPQTRTLGQQMGDILTSLPTGGKRLPGTQAEMDFQREGAGIGGPVVNRPEPTPNPLDLGVLGEPLIEPSKLLEEPYEGEPASLSFLRGLLHGTEQVTSPASLATIAATGGLGALGRGGLALQRAAVPLFEGMAVTGAGGAAVSGYRKMQAGDVNGAWRDWGMGSADAAFAALLARATFRNMRATAADIKTGWDAWRKSGGSPEPSTPGSAEDIQQAWEAARESSPTAKSGATTLAQATTADIQDALAESRGEAPAPRVSVIEPEQTPLPKAETPLRETPRPQPTAEELANLDDFQRKVLADLGGAGEGATEVHAGPRFDPKTGAVTPGPGGLHMQEAGKLLDSILDEHQTLLDQIAEKGKMAQPDPLDRVNQGEALLNEIVARPGESVAEPPAPRPEGVPGSEAQVAEMFPNLRPAPVASETSETPFTDFVEKPEAAQPVAETPQNGTRPPAETVAEQPQPAPQPHAGPAPSPPVEAPSDERTGDQVRVKTARGTTAMARYQVVEIGDLVTSHDRALNVNPDYPAELQPRDRTRKASEAQIAEIAGNLDPEELGANYKASDGAPIVDDDGKVKVVVSGNGRTLAVDRLYEQGHPNAEKYRQWLIENAPAFGIDPDEVEGMQKPFLVRTINGKLMGLDLAKFAQEANEDSKAAMSASEQANADAGRLTPQHMALFAPGDEGDLLASSNRGFVRAFLNDVVPSGERANLMDSKGELSQAGVNRIRNAVFAKAYGADTAVIEKLAESTDSNIRNVTGGMVQAAPAFAQMREAIASGDLHGHLDLSGEVAEAAEQLAAIRREKGSASDYLHQIGLFGDDMTQEGKALLALFDQYGRSGKKIATILNSYTDAVRAAGNPKQAAIFAGKPPSKQEVLAAAIQQAEASFRNETQRPEESSGPSLFDESQPAPSGGAPEAHGPAAPTGSGQPGTAEPESAAEEKPGQGSAPAGPDRGEESGEAGSPEANPHPTGPGSDAGGQRAGAGERPDRVTPEEEKFVAAVGERLGRGDALDNPEIARMAKEAFGGGRLEGKYDIKRVYDLVEAAVARWQAGQGGWNEDAPGALTDAERMTNQLPRQADRTGKQEAYQQFSTPPTLALVAAAAAHLRPDDVVLEPSAGTGMLAAWAKSAGVAEVHTNEIDPGRRQILKSGGFEPTAHDAEQLHNLTDLKPSVVLMNPPFSAAGHRGITKDQTVGQRHVEQALLALREGGRLVAILPGGRDGFEGEGASMRSTAWGKWWERIMAQYHVRANIGIPGKAYGKFGTTFATRLVVIDKDGPTPGSNILQQLQGVESKNVDSLKEALDALGPAIADRPEAVSADPGSAGDGHGRPQRPARQTGRKRGPGGRRAGVSPARQAGTEPVPGGVPEAEPQSEPPVGDGSGDRERGPVNPEPAKPKRVEQGVQPVEPGVNPEALQSHEVGEGTFATYLPQKLTGGAEHPAAIVQSAPLAAVDSPDITYTPALDPGIFTSGKLSNVQAEAVYYAGMRHSRTLSTGERAGIFIGDGTGVGKGREIAGIIADNWAQGRKRSIWMSVSSDLIESAQRDLEDLGVKIPIKVVNDWKATEDIDLDEGIVFCTYASLIGESKGADENAPPSKRIDQLAKWVGDGQIVFDEAHKAKNAWDSGTGEPTQTGLAVLKIQEKLPQARVVYASATGATDPVNMAYMTRLGMWGDGTAFHDFGVFLGEIEGGGVGAMEMVARDMKARGAYLARTISYEGVGYREANHQLTDQQRAMYDVASRAWLTVIRGIEGGIQQTHAPGRARAKAMSLFWSAHQRFFKQLITAIKVPTAIAEIEKALAEGKSAIISVMSTGEAQQERLISRNAEQGGELDDIDFSPREALDQLIVRVFPIHANEEVKDPKTGKTSWRPVLDADKNPVIDKQALAAREALRDSLTDINIPDNPIDQIIGHFEKQGQGVAELTGRKRRIEKNALTGKKEIKKRKAEGVASKRTNLAETKAFQDGTKHIAIISDAASTGISLHADRRAKNQQQRVHIALELKWSADKQLQDFGRSHRSNQVQPPEYVLISTDIGGDKRFSSTIARRLASLGALTQGSRDATSGGEIAKYNFESNYGRAAVQRTLRTMYQSLDGQQTLLDMGLIKKQSDGSVTQLKDQDLQDVPRFLNRVLSLDLARQNRTFTDFIDAFAGAIDLAKRQGTFDEGVSDVKAEAIRLTGSQVVHTDPIDGSETKYYGLELDEKTNPLSFGDAGQKLKLRVDLDDRGGQGEPMGYYRNKRSGHITLMLASGTETDPKTGTVTRHYASYTARGNSTRVEEAELADKYEMVTAKAARPWWDEQFEQAPKIHTRQMHIVGGAILGVWRQLQAAGARGMTVRRVTSDRGERVVGLEIPSSKVAEVLRALGVGRDLVKPEDVFAGVLDGEEIQLAADLKLRRTKVHGETAIELVGVGLAQFNEMDGLGLIRNRIDSKVRFFVPTDPKTGVPIVEKLLERYPVIRQTTGGQRAGRRRVAVPVEGRAQAIYRAGSRSEPPILYATPKAAAVVQALFDDTRPDQTELDFAGVRMTPAAVALVTGRWRWRLQNGGLSQQEKADELQALRVFRQAETAKHDLVMVVAGQSLHELKQTLREELFHHQQGQLGEFRHLDVGHIDARRFLDDDRAKVAVYHLTEDYRYAGDPDEMASEIGAHLAAGNWEALGLTEPQAKALFRRYARFLTERHGPMVVFCLRHISPILRQAFEHGASEGNPAQTGAQTQSIRFPRPGARPTSPQVRRGDPEAYGDGSHSLLTVPLNHANQELTTPASAEGVGAEDAAADSRFAEGRGGVQPEVGRDLSSARFSRLPGSALRAAAETVYATRDDLRKVANPTALGTEAKTAGLSLRNHAAEMAQTFARAEEALDEARAAFAKRDWAENLDFINRVESGQQQPDADLQVIADTMRQLLDAHRLAVQALGKNKLTQFYVNYFPHIWKRPEQAASVFAQIFGKRPIEGTKAFLKQRKLQTFQEGVDRGLEPVSENPVDLVLLKVREMERYILAHRFLAEMRGVGLAKYVPAIGKKSVHPEGWVKIPDAIGTVWRPPIVPVKEAMDKEMLDGLTDIAQKLGIGTHRGTSVRGQGREWGLATGNSIFTKFGGPESVIVHEIGHVLDSRYHLADQLRGQPYENELRALADLRLTGGDPAWYEKYVHKEGEQAANMVAAYVHTRARMQRVAPHVFEWFDDFVRRTPELAGLRNLEYGMQLAEQTSDLNVGGFIQVGHYYMPPGAAQIIANYLSPGLGYKPWYQVLRTTSNLMLQFALGFSAFHAGFTTMDAAISKLAIGLKYAAAGHPLEAAKQMALVPIAPVLNVIKGGRIRAAYLDQACNDPELAKYVEAIVAGGGRVKMDEVYRTKMRQKFMDACRNHELGGALLTGLPALAETTVWPILEWLVPRQKLGVFADMVDFEMERLGPNATRQEVRQAFARAWDSVDNRMGQLVYDDLFWNRTLKDLMMITVQSLGWNAGTFREIGGAGIDAARFVRDGGRFIGGGIGGGKGSGSGRLSITGAGGPPPAPTATPTPEFTHRMAYVASLVLLTGAIGAITTYLATGHGPKDKRDYFFPQVGSRRWALPSYMKDVFHWSEDPVAAAKGKIHPWLRVTAEMLTNADWQNREIYDKNDPWYTIGLDLAKHLGSTFEPYAWRNEAQLAAEGATPAERIAPFFGVAKAPSYIAHTKAERLLAEYIGENMPKSAQSKTDYERKQARRALEDAVRRKDPEAKRLALEDLRTGVLTVKDERLALSNVGKDPQVGRLAYLAKENLERAFEVYRAGSAEERAKFRPVMTKAFLSAIKNETPQQIQALVGRFRAEIEELRGKRPAA